uniref:Myomesin-2-like n=1 Tax=Cyprinodon variegatus TaxID=28743 RepID=A0A3Q2G1S0_CYPVA
MTSPRYAVFDLAEGKQYQFRVLSANMYGTSEPSKPTPVIETLELKGVPSAPGQVIATRETDTSVLIQWAPPKEPNNLIGYYIDQCVQGSKDWTSANHKPHKDTKFVVSGLKTGETYVFRVQAINELGLSDESQESAPLTVRAALTTPSAPYDVALLNCDGRSMVLNWKKPLHSGGAKIKEYYVDKRRSGTSIWREVHIPPVTERVEGLTEGAVYQFHVYAANLAGLGPASKHSDDFKCEAWTMPEPGPAYDLSFCEVRDSSLVVEWQKPIYTGSDPITGYHVEYSKKGTSDWKTFNEKAVSHRFLKVTGLELGTCYVFRVRAVNAAGVGMASMPSDPVIAKAVEGNQEVSCTVDEKSGDIVLSFESCQMNEGSQFVWKKNYKEITDFSKGVVIKTEGNQSKLIFKNPDKEDAGTYSVSVTGTDGVSSSYAISAEELEKMLALSYDIRHPIIPLKSELAYKILERGRMRFWLQAEEISSKVTYKFFANNKELSGADVRDTRLFQKEKHGKDGLSELFMWIYKPPNFFFFFVANLKKESEFHWYKDDTEIIPDVKPDLSSGVCKLPIKEVKRSNFCSPLIVKHHFYNKYALSPSSGASAAELVVKCTATGIQLQCHMKYYTSEMNISCEHKLTHSDKTVIGGTPAMATMEVIEPTEKDKGAYSIVITNSENSYKRAMDLSGDDQGKFASLTIKGVSMEDSGRYTMIVQNKYGGESVDIVVSVYRAGEKIPEAKPALTPKTIIPPKLPIEIPQPKTQTTPSATSPAPPAASPAAPKAAPGRGMKSPTPSRRK